MFCLSTAKLMNDGVANFVGDLKAEIFIKGKWFQISIKRESHQKIIMGAVFGTGTIYLT